MVALAMLALLFGCATMNFGLKNRLALAYNTVTAYVKQSESLYDRGRITNDQARKVRDGAHKAGLALDYASGVSKVCPSNPCTTADQLAIAERILIDLEKELKANE
jgi:hypothetical protein